ncbi:hypothetical protein PpBr36_04981 [Pyricularia pennisetigena]|uniref:hypothetical protein n=1 Tax=Pyricularia pennisetigena TaxID=1578925 RepID=UPI00114F7D62|nr:hypothetical protein PpBr36_04981 [Pyricularia pennisetigena]TLS27429.1 hypothetical protein PpBr36_04981 [Pyricularia pennisetigena]
MARSVTQLLPKLFLLITFLSIASSYPTATNRLLLLPRDPKDCTAPDANCTCQEWTFASKDWTVANFAYRISVPVFTPQDEQEEEEEEASRLEPVPFASLVTFVVQNKALDYNAVCNATSTGQDQQDADASFDGEEWYDCVQDKAGEEGVTSFSYDRARDRLEVKQTWECLHEGYFYRYKATGGAEAKVVCAEAEWENPDWKEGQTYQLNITECQAKHRPMQVPWTEITGS